MGAFVILIEFVILYILEYSPGLELNFGQLTHPNWKVLSLNFNPLSI